MKRFLLTVDQIRDLDRQDAEYEIKSKIKFIRHETLIYSIVVFITLTNPITDYTGFLLNKVYEFSFLKEIGYLALLVNVVFFYYHAKKRISETRDEITIKILKL